ncbi:RING-H2 finger protein ATL8-like protein [Tanacetum coccineum]
MTRYTRFLTTITNSTSSSSSSSSFDQTSAEPPEAVAVESDFVVILAALLCALICVLGLIAVARCAWLRRSSITTTRRNNPTSPTANKGVKKKIVETLPKFVYNVSGEKKISSDCAICLSEYVDGDEIRVLPQCGHGFHVGCIDLWLSSHSSCPSCRQVLVVTRCRKCGEFPAVSAPVAAADQSAAAPDETARKSRAHDSTSCSNDYLP